MREPATREGLLSGSGLVSKMAFIFATSTDQTVEVVSTVDPSVIGTEEAKVEYLSTRDESLFDSTEGATRFTLRALSPQAREDAEVEAGAYSRSELGRILWTEQPDDPKERARWQHDLPEDERRALGEYNRYLSRVYREMLRAGLVSIEGHDGDPLELVDSIRPDHHRQVLMGELVAHIQALSLLPPAGK